MFICGGLCSAAIFGGAAATVIGAAIGASHLGGNSDIKHIRKNWRTRNWPNLV